MYTHVLGLPRIGAQRELKKAIEAYWKGNISLEQLEQTGKNIRQQNLYLQKEMDFDFITVGDFSYYDQVLDMSMTLGAIPKRFQTSSTKSEIDTYFAMARGTQNAKAMEMTKWFDTNYHYIVPEFYKGQQFSLNSNKIIVELEEAKNSGFANLKPILIGPLTYLCLGKSQDKNFDKWSLIDPIIDIYIELLIKISPYCEWIQIDEPILVLNLPSKIKELFIKAYKKIKKHLPSNNKILLATYFEDILDNKDTVLSLPIDGLHLDLIRGKKQLNYLHEFKNTFLSLGIINGRNIWKANLNKILDDIKNILSSKSLDIERIMLSTSCSLLHVPIDLEYEKKLSLELKSWMSFAKQKCEELKILKQALEGKDVSKILEENQKTIDSRQKSTLRTITNIQDKLSQINTKMFQRQSSYKERNKKQRSILNLPLFPTTTIGSFPQTPEIRKTRLLYKKGELNEQEYKQKIKKFIDEVIQRQEELGLDVFVHGEPERNDMVEYFGQQLKGYCSTENGWVQSYGTRCVKPPIIYGDIERPSPMTIEWITYAQSKTTKPVKGMLTGPITMLCWSFVRDDQPRKDTAFQLALAIREEVKDLEKANIKVIQIDEPALREGLPLKQNKWSEYLSWAINAFKLATSGVKDETQIHTHMCYSDFEDIIEWIAKMDADVISIEASRSKMELLEVFKEFNYPNEIGPGIYDIHSPRVPSIEEIKELLELALKVIPKEKLWVNPDCGLKTREWPETLASLKNMVSAAKMLREKYK